MGRMVNFVLHVFYHNFVKKSTNHEFFIKLSNPSCVNKTSFFPSFDLVLFFKELFILYWGTANEQCCDTSKWTGMGLSHTYTCVQKIVLSTPFLRNLIEDEHYPTKTWLGNLWQKDWWWTFHIFNSELIWPASWETCVQVRKQQLELDMEQQTGSK